MRLREVLRTTGPDEVILIITAASVLLIDLIWGIAIGVALHVIFTKFLKKKVN
jgi:MFS superfamily sulfate permease-like transporter